MLEVKGMSGDGPSNERSRTEDRIVKVVVQTEYHATLLAEMKQRIEELETEVAELKRALLIHKRNNEPLYTSKRMAQAKRKVCKNLQRAPKKKPKT
jgi:hypothetical protein